ncbi:MAG TPA: GNAT family N-acetyltransferase [Pirellulales bacterium]|nr:GNAT family N-acetyltransferase [Pirellulales bacterium]
MRDPLQTARLILRDITEADAELLRELDSDLEVMRYISTAPLPELASYRDRIRTVYVPGQAHAWHGIRMVLDRLTGEFLGWVFARPACDSTLARDLGWTSPDEIEVGYRYRRAAWGRGLATEAPCRSWQMPLKTPRQPPWWHAPTRGTQLHSGYSKSSACCASAKPSYPMATNPP